MILLDTNVVSAVMQNRPDPAVVGCLNQQPASEIWLPSVVVFKLRYGLALLPAGARRRRLEQGLETLLSELVQGRIAPLITWRPVKHPSLPHNAKPTARQWICATP